MSLPSELAFAPATVLADAISAHRASAREVLEAHLVRIERLDPALGAVVRRDDARARARALAADEALAKGELWGVLHGVPFTLKDQHPVAGLETSTGHAGGEHSATKDGVVAERLRSAGGILMGKTQMALNVQGLSTLFGRVVNPWDPKRVAGGSSGGAAVAVAARLAPFDVGADATGSIRMPAHFCGVFGLRPTTGRIASVDDDDVLTSGARVGRDIATAGPIARTAEDVGLLLRVLAGPHPRDPQVPPVPLPDLRPVEPRRVKLALVLALDDLPIARATQRALHSAARRLEAAGARIDEVTLPFSHVEVLEAFRALFRPAMEVLAKGGGGPPGRVLPDAPMSAVEWLTAVGRRDARIARFEEWLGDRDAVMCPSAIRSAFPTGALGSPVEVDGELVSSMMVDHPCLLATLLGAPAFTVPIGRDDDGLPVGAQLVGRRWDDARLVATGATISTVLGPLPPPPLAVGEAA